MSRNSKSINKAVTGASPGIGGGSGGRRGGGGSKGGVETSTSWDRDTNVTFSRNFSFKIIDRKLNKVVWACYLNLEPNLNGVLYSEDVNRSVLRNILESYPAKTVASSEIVKRTAICTVRDSPEAVREFLFQYQFSYDMGGFRSVSIRKDTAYIETKMGMSPLGATSRKTFFVLQTGKI
jgi:hypothetical protein